MRLVAQVRNEIDFVLPLKTLFETPKVKELSSLITSYSDCNVYKPILPLRVVGDKPPLFCIHPAGGMATVFTKLANALESGRPIFGIQARGLEIGEDPFSSLSELLEAYTEAISALIPSGPLNIIGYSAGGPIAHEIACYFQDKGRDIGFVGLIDSFLPKKINPEDCQSKEEIIIAMAEDFGFEVKANTTREQLFKIALSLAVNQGIIPIGTPLEWVDRLLNETIAASRRLTDYNPRIGKFDMVYFSAELDDLTPDSLERRLAWKKYCRSVVYHPIQEKHMRILDVAPSSIIAKIIDAYIKN
jgi:thioesterase domain-containing protein